MSVFKRPGQSTYTYDFRHKGSRFSGQTGCTTEREAKKFEDAVKREIKASTVDVSKPMTVMTATTLYWEEVGQFLANKDDCIRSLAWIQTQFGNRKQVSDIDSAAIARAVARRRGEGVSNATVNRSVTEPLRAIFRRAAKIWKQRVQDIEWKHHLLPEAQEIVREASQEEEAKFMDAVRGDYAPALRFAILSGCRRSEIVGLRQKHLDWFTKTIAVTGKRDKTRKIPMTQAIYDLLWPLRRDMPDDPVFTYICRRPLAGQVKGREYPITTEGFKTEWRRTRGRAGVMDFRFHDTRHTAATRLVRATGNLKLAQRLLGHADIATTSRYAHVTDADLRAGMEAANAAPDAKTTTENAAAKKKEVGNS